MDDDFIMRERWIMLVNYGMALFCGVFIGGILRSELDAVDEDGGVTDMNGRHCSLLVFHSVKSITYG